MSGYGWRPHIEAALRLKLADLFRHRALQPNGTTSGSWVWTRDDKRIATIDYTSTLGETDGELRLSYTWTHNDEPKDVTCTILVSSLKLNYGGRRWYLHCPYTGRRALILYKFGSVEQFCHRTAIRPLPTYHCQRESGTSRIFAQRWALRRKLGDEFSDLMSEPYKPKWMRWRTFERYVARDAELAEREYGYLIRFIGRMMN